MSTLRWVLILLAIGLFASAESCDWKPVDWRSVPKALPDDIIQVRYLVAPLLWCSIGDALSYLGAYHGGVATINARTGLTYTFNMGAAPTFEGALLPKIQTFGNGTYNVTATNHAVTLVYDGIDTSYWNTHDDHIADMTGDQFNQFLLWIGSCNTTFPRYDTFSVYNEFPDKCFLSGYECFEFAFDCVRKIQELGGKLVPGLTTLPRSIMMLFSDYAPVKVDVSTPEVQNDLINFFEALEGGWDRLGIVGFFEELWKIAESGEFYFMHGPNFYYVPLKYPFLEGRYVEMPIPLVNSSL